jgi:hypothetical protein
MVTGTLREMHLPTTHTNLSLIWYLAGAKWWHFGGTHADLGYGYGDGFGDGLHYGFLNGTCTGYGHRHHADDDDGSAYGFDWNIYDT